MPELSRFYGIVIKLFFDDHAPPHFHATYADREAVVRIEPLGVIAGSLPPRATGLVIEWATLHQQELKEAWERAKSLETPEKIAPLP